MARYTGAVCKLCRREGKKLFLKGDKCTSQACPLEKRNYAPGQHGAARKKLSEYGLQLRAKQTARRYYGLSESQFHKYFLMATRQNGMAGENLLRICESRLDNVVYLLGWAESRAEARQLVAHGHYLVNGKRVDIPSYLIKKGDTLAIAKNSLDSEKFKAILEKTGNVPAWLEVNDDNTAKVLDLPQRDQIDVPVEEHLIVEYYSK
jgi:small subunit ribosomal protein S4